MKSTTESVFASLTLTESKVSDKGSKSHSRCERDLVLFRHLGIPNRGQVGRRDHKKVEDRIEQWVDVRRLRVFKDTREHSVVVVGTEGSGGKTECKD